MRLHILGVDKVLNQRVAYDSAHCAAIESKVRVSEREDASIMHTTVEIANS